MVNRCDTCKYNPTCREKPPCPCYSKEFGKCMYGIGCGNFEKSEEAQDEQN